MILSALSKLKLFKYTSGLLFLIFIAYDSSGQNRMFMTGASFGIGNSGFKITDKGEDELKRIYYPTVGLPFQTRISDDWALYVHPNVGLSGNKRTFKNPVNNITKITTTSALVNLAVHGKYFLTEKSYVSFGPEISYLLWNSGSTYSGETRLSRLTETRFFNRWNFFVSSTLGYSTKVTESLKRAKIKIDVLWFIEFRAKQGLTNILSKDFFENNLKSRILSFELATGFTFASKQ